MNETGTNRGNNAGRPHPGVAPISGSGIGSILELRTERIRTLRRVLRTGMATVLLLVVATSVWPNSLTELPENSELAASDAPWHGLEEAFRAVAESVPGFGSLFIDDDGITNIWLTEPRAAAATEAKAALVAARAGHVLSDEVKVLKARYAFSELKSWQDEIRDELGALPGITLVGIDDRGNRLLIGVEDRNQHEPGVRALLARLDIPQDALNLIEASRPTQELRQERRPIRGGLQVGVEISGVSTLEAYNVCTMGFIAVRSGTSGFVTNAHCSMEYGSVDNGRYWQPAPPLVISPLLLGDDRVGRETVDPSFRSGITGCPANSVCRHSDANFVRAEVSTARGTIARVGVSSPNWNGTNLYRIANWTEYPVGTVVSKVGRSTGRSSGTISYRCVDVPLNGAHTVWLLCQNFAPYVSDDGDSGAPVFRITNSPSTNDVVLAGIHWGRVTLSDGTLLRAFSGIGRVQQDLGTLTVVAPGCPCS